MLLSKTKYILWFPNNTTIPRILGDEVSEHVLEIVLQGYKGTRSYTSTIHLIHYNIAKQFSGTLYTHHPHT